MSEHKPPPDAEILAWIAGADGPQILAIVERFCRRAPLEPGPTPLAVCDRVRAMIEARWVENRRGRYYATGAATYPQPEPDPEDPKAGSGGDIFGGITL